MESYLAKDNIDLSAPVLIKKIPEVTVCSMQQRIESYDNLFSLMPEMGAEMERLGCICAEPAYCFIRYLEPGYSDEDILVEACEAVTEKKRVPIRWHSRCFRKFPRLPVYITEALTTPFIDPTFRY